MKMCAFQDCPNPASPKAAKGLCSSHYWQMHKGRPLTALSYRRDVTEPWIMAHLNYDGVGCLSWPFGRSPDGRATVRFKGRQGWAARVICQLVNGPPPFNGAEAAHSCGKGHLGCVNPKHLRWATKLENEADKMLHGTIARGEHQGSSKMTDGKVRAIREFARTCSQHVIADLFGIAQVTVSRIVARKTWRHVT